MAEADLRLLGQAIKRFREGAPSGRVSQFQLATLMKWQGTAPVIEIEKGRRRPRPETLNALGEALALSPPDVAYLHGLAGYREVSAMPPVEHINRVLDAIESELAQRLYPVHVLDFQFRHWMVNPATAVLVGGSLETARDLLYRGVHGFDVVFDSRLPVRARFTDPESVERERVFRFKYHNLYRRFEPFYRAYPERMKGRLTARDYERFAACWSAVEVATGDVFPVHPEVTVRLGRWRVTFVIHLVELLQLDRKLYVGYYEPKQDGAENRQRCEDYFTRHRIRTGCLRATPPADPGAPEPCPNP
jgi:hypothetical protein